MIKAISLLGAGFLSCGAFGLELLEARRLPDDGFGSNANAALADHPLMDDVAFVFGSKTTADGKMVPTVWRVDPSNVIMDEIPASLRGEAIGGAIFENGDMVVVGNVQIGNGQHAALWRKPWMGQWSGPEPLAPNAEGSLAARAAYCSNGGLFVAVDVQLNGRTIAAAFSLDLDGITAGHFLPTPGGGSSSAREILVDCTGFMTLTVAGSITDPNGNTRPAIWRHTENGWATFPSSIRRSEGVANSIILLDNDGETEVARYDVCGTLLRSGRTLGFAARGAFANIETDYLLLPPLQGYDNSAGVSHLGDTGTHEVGHWMGLSSNRGGLAVATLWIAPSVDSEEMDSVRGRPVPARQLLVDPSAVSQMLRIEEAGAPNLFVGQCMDEEDFPFPSAFLFTPAGWFLPETGDEVLLGVASETHREPDGLWHDDGNVLRIATQPRDQERAAVVDLRFAAGPMPASATEDFRRCMWPLCGGFMLTASALSNHGEAGGTLNVYALNPASGEYTLRGTFGLTGAPRTIEAFTWDCLDQDHCVVAETGEVRVRLEFVQAKGGAGALSLDSARLRKTTME